MDSRRDFLRKSALLSLGGIVTKAVSEEKLGVLEKMSGENFSATTFTLPPLPYAYDALEPFIDKQTMELHHDKHHKAYVDKLNEALPKVMETGKSQVAINSIEDVFKNYCFDSPTIVNNGGGHYNHSLFWTLMKPNKDGKPNVPAGKIADAINASFTSFEEFKKQFSDAGMKRFGSGWAWLSVSDKKLKISSTANQENPLMKFSEVQGTPLLALDVWEHAYYLKYQNKRTDYINNWWNVVNWDKVNELFSKT